MHFTFNAGSRKRMYEWEAKNSQNSDACIYFTNVEGSNIFFGPAFIVGR